MMYYVFNLIFFIIGSYFLYSSNVFLINYFDIFNLMSEISKINLTYLALSIIFYAAFFTLTSMIYLKSEQKELFLALPFYALFLLLIGLLGISLINMVVILLELLILYYYFNKIYEKKYIYKKIPYKELSYKLLSITFTLLSLYFTFALTYTLIKQQPITMYVDDFLESTTGFDFSKSKDNIYENMNSEINMIIENINKYLQYYIQSSNIHQKQECINIVKEGMNNLNITPNIVETNKIDELYYYKGLLIKTYPLIALFVYYSLASFYFFFVRIISYLFLFLWEKLFK